MSLLKLDFECVFCKELFATPQDLISHISACHTNSSFSTFISSSAAATTNFHQHPHQNQNLNVGFSNLDAFHISSPFATTFFSSVSATTNFHQFPHQIQNPNFGFSVRNPTQEFRVRNPTLDFPVRNPFDLNYCQGGPLNNQRRFQREFPLAQAINPTKNYNRVLPKLMDLLPATPAKDIRTLSLLSQLEKPWPKNIGTGNNGIKSSSIDFSLRL